jgi:hypothetical protein
MHSVHAHFEQCLFPSFTNLLIHFLAGFVHHLFNAGRMDAPILNQLFQSNAGNLAPDGIKAG